jgi:hypothetical protein
LAGLLLNIESAFVLFENIETSIDNGVVKAEYMKKKLRFEGFQREHNLLTDQVDRHIEQLKAKVLIIVLNFSKIKHNIFRRTCGTASIQKLKPPQGI